ncbi:hypothetical protein HXX76_004844 [Chlamydomonas incerta]|uniref:Adenosylmethionine-8-amino-7-oxononanoate aminotransferase n=1 Tax=Chlamydomonas incerta TaxID=51695 RepID=A0A835TKQ2_CHLIN|nr:hypothetical protein HXX76_004844 [Chlamydomonas incerta]|eukprot:KAG2439490.1 hypothetical protein HXX76_004844 [Chlamydomonas incerta]
MNGQVHTVRVQALACGGVAEPGQHAAVAAVEAAQPLGHTPGGGSGGPGSAAGGAGAGGYAPPRCSTLFAWRHAVSPHLAVQLEGRPVSDDELVVATGRHMAAAAEQLQRAAVAAAAAEGGSGSSGSGSSSSSRALLLMETAGGVTSPAPSGRLTCDVLRPLRLPCVLVGDPRLGGIAATLSALDSLVARGWEVEAVVLVGQSQSYAAGGPQVALDNADFLRAHLAGPAACLHRLGAPPPEVVAVPACGPAPEGHDVRRDGLDPALAAWLPAARPAFTALLEALARRHAARLARLAAAAAAAEAQLWWPFTQHASLTPGAAATVIDSRCGDTWMALCPPAAGGAAGGGAAAAALTPLYDGSCSWWTQAATTELQPELARAVGAAAGRYLHVLFPEVAHEPALAAAAALLGPGGPGAGWAARVFYSDDGSTAIEVALKMAFRKFLAERGELGEYGDPNNGSSSTTTTGSSTSSSTGSSSSSTGSSTGGGELLVLGLQGAYHGDTLGAQDCVAPSVFNGRLQAPWYRGRGLFLEPPYVAMSAGRWQLQEPPAWLRHRHPGPLPSWASLDDLLAGSSSDSGSSNGSSQLQAAYTAYIESAIDDFEAGLRAQAEAAAAAAKAAAATAGGGSAAAVPAAPAAAPGRLAACIMEPLLQGAGGMLLIEPGFQRAMAQVARARCLPLIADEVFTGLLRAGHVSAAAAAGITPDIACYGKLLTGGAAPLAVTLASAEVFAAFQGPSKLFALLHGHSYTAYPIGAAAAAAAVRLLTDPATNPNLCAPGRPGCCGKSPACTAPCGRLLPLFDEQGAVAALSHHPLVSRVVAAGTVLAVEVRTAPQEAATSASASSSSSFPSSPASSSTAASQAATPRYGSVSSAAVVRRLRADHGIYARPLGSVVYLMAPPTAPRERAAWLAGCLAAALDACLAEARAGPGTAGAGAGGAGREEGVVV